MALQYVTLIGAADAFGVHPRTILRAIHKKHNVYWTEDINEDRIAVADVANAYGMTTRALNVVLDGRDKLLNAQEAARELGIADRTFRKHLPDRQEKWGRVHHGGITRYLFSKVRSAAIDSLE